MADGGGNGDVTARACPTHDDSSSWWSLGWTAGWNIGVGHEERMMTSFRRGCYATGWCSGCGGNVVVRILMMVLSRGEHGAGETLVHVKQKPLDQCLLAVDQSSTLNQLQIKSGREVLVLKLSLSRLDEISKHQFIVGALWLSEIDVDRSESASPVRLTDEVVVETGRVRKCPSDIFDGDI